MAKVYGIDLGTTYSVIATLDDNGMPEVIENFNDGIPLLASAVYFPGGGDPVVGKEAKNQAEVESDRVVQFVKRQIGEKDAQVWTFDGVTYDPITISALILKRMKEYATEQGHDVQDVVITCPAYFKIPHRNATRQAGQIAGFNVLNIVNEPTAAALNYCCREFRESRKIMVFDLGGGTFDVTLSDFSVSEDDKASINVIRTGGDKRLGGIDWDARLYDHICELYTKENGVSQDEMDAELRQKIRSQVEDIKKSISNMPSKSFTISYAGDTTRLEVTREKFEEITKDLVERTMDFVHQLLKEAKFSADDVNVVVLVGGSTRMPMIKDAVEKIFPGKVRFENPDLAVARGAALAASIEVPDYMPDDEESDPSNTSSSQTSKPLEGEKSGNRGVKTAGGGEIKVGDILSSSFGPAVFDENGKYVIDNLLFLGDPAPAEASQVYGTMVDNQEIVELCIFGNASEDRENHFLKPCLDEQGDFQETEPELEVMFLDKVSLNLPPNTPKGAEIKVKFCFGTNGLDVYVTYPGTNEPKHHFIAIEGGKTEQEMNEAIKRFASVRTSGQI
jgi:molecular chaperone DnaK (HSP70)